MVIVVLIFIVNLGLLSWAITDMLPRKNVKYLPKAGWIAMIAVIPYSSVLYLLAGRGDEK